MKITYGICVCNEFIEIQTLIRHLLRCKRPQDNIVILYDENNGDKEIETYLRSHSVNGEFSWFKGGFNRNFAEWKNHLNSLCSGDFIFNIDADEIPDEVLLERLPQIIELNPEIDAYWVPRVNTLGGDVKDIIEYVHSQGWQFNEKGQINFPDPQLRLYRNKPEIKWEGDVHETIKGYETISRLPFEEEYCLYHPKTLAKQIKQNNLYKEL